MIFVLQYNRQSGRLVRMTKFRDSDRQQAQEARLRLELKLSRSQTRDEVVLLEAPSEKILRQTHRRYFHTAAELARTIPEATS